MDKVTEADREAAKNFSNLAYLRRLQHEALERALAQAFATNRIEAAKAERDRLRELAAGPAAWLGRWAKHVGDCQGGCVCSCGLTLAQMEAEQLIAALESKP